MTYEPTSTVRARRLRERRSKGVVMVAPVEVGEGGVGRPDQRTQDAGTRTTNTSGPLGIIPKYPGRRQMVGFVVATL